MLLRALTIVFDIPLRRKELKFFRGAMIKCAGREQYLFHNHQGDGFVYKYPQIQYRIVAGRAAVFCLEQGVEQMMHLLSSGAVGQTVDIGERKGVPLTIFRLSPVKLVADIVDEQVRYRIYDWLPFNQSNFQIYNSRQSDDQVLPMLNRILTANILSFAKGVGWHIQSRVECRIDPDTISSRIVKYKNQKLISLSLEFTANLLLPSKIGLGKGVSISHGLVSYNPKSEEE
jgi:hypothetical protein